MHAEILSFLAAGAMAAASHLPAVSPFAAHVIDYSPAPGQFVQNPAFNDPARALGAPVGGGTAAPDNSKLVSLGGAGGSITLAFDHTVRDERGNPFGMDFIVFGNASWVAGNPNRKWAECAHVEISPDANGNGLADDRWYLIRGSHIADPWSQWTEYAWDDDVDDAELPPEDETWIPAGRSGTWTSVAHALPTGVFGFPVLVNPHGTGASTEGVVGYADLSPTLIRGDTNGDNVVDEPALIAEEFYTKPDNPWVVGVSAGSGGGDAFDIRWAVDPVTGQPARLAGFDFIRITTAVDRVDAVFGETSAEIGGVADVRSYLGPDGGAVRVGPAGFGLMAQVPARAVR